MRGGFEVVEGGDGKGRGRVWVWDRRRKIGRMSVNVVIFLRMELAVRMER